MFASLTDAHNQPNLPDISFSPSAIQSAQLNALRSAHEHGLAATDYDLQILEEMVADRESTDTVQFTDRLNAAFRRYAKDISLGHLSPLTDPEWHIPQQPLLIDQPDTTIDDIENLAPPHPAYKRLHAAMTRYQALRQGGGWKTIPAGPKLSLGILHPQSELVRNRLRMTNDFDDTTPANAYLFDSALDKATRGFQTRHGLLVNGIIDAATRKAMNVSLEDRIQQLSIAMERWRWLPRDLGDQYVWVNAAEARIDMIIGGKPVLSMRTIVGHSTRPTPSLQSEIRRIIFNPAWSVPQSIATEDLLPKLRNDHSHLKRNNFRIYTGSSNKIREVNPNDVDWSGISPNNFPYRFIQQPGPGNSLGRIKFIFDNPYNIYVHDTPSKALFALRTRTFSSGCVRLEQADEFASALLAADQNWTNADTQRYLDDGRTQGISLQRKIPIYLVYITSWVTEDGRAHFRRDLYHRDAAVSAASIANHQLPINHQHQF
ncbi:MAG TPA: L,D-transpeptidase family protein [Gammaproteobacteria bacterium]|jgi:murein L,D-transpeptidase YcbB/YkuD|nr:L,D-transpeptidase family protein [Gammaproteobacteria bacterium]MDP7296549.1 L,D-transpeptidase family protein [Gammaproteobacteria bacterium]MDP7659743.1 L,D-transpeptidase family protein [Gammaproteobacteria bacterium]HJP39567.1 L,D-transpeptidase family protein [Gammaproteobacteria bacterium]